MSDVLPYDLIHFLSLYLPPYIFSVSHRFHQMYNEDWFNNILTPHTYPLWQELTYKELYKRAMKTCKFYQENWGEKISRRMVRWKGGVKMPEETKYLILTQEISDETYVGEGIKIVGLSNGEGAFVLTFNGELFQIKIDRTHRNKINCKVSRDFVQLISSKVIDMDSNTYVTWDCDDGYTWHYYSDLTGNVKLLSQKSQFRDVAYTSDGIYFSIGEYIHMLSKDALQPMTTFARNKLVKSFDLMHPCDKIVDSSLGAMFLCNNNVVIWKPTDRVIADEAINIFSNVVCSKNTTVIYMKDIFFLSDMRKTLIPTPNIISVVSTNSYLTILSEAGITLYLMNQSPYAHVQTVQTCIKIANLKNIFGNDFGLYYGIKTSDG